MSFQLSLSTESVSAAYPDEPLFVIPSAPIGEVIQLFGAQQSGSVLVCESDSTDGGKLLGIFTERDALKCIAAVSSGQQSDLMSKPVSEVMSTELKTLEADTSMGEAIKLMSQGGYRHLPIIDAESRPIGMETVHGIVHYLVDHFPQTVYNLPPNPRTIPAEREGA
ncbi:MAG: CBS domain-containing protein [Planctomycetota bacterium]